MSEVFAQVLLPLALDEAFTYRAEEEIEIGDVVKVQFGRKEIWGVVVEIKKSAPEKLAEAKIKKILAINSRVKFSKNQLKFIEVIATYNLASRGLVLRAFIGILNSDKTKKLSKGLEQKIEPEKYKVLIFDGKHYHATGYCNKHERRVICIFNFITEDDR